MLRKQFKQWVEQQVDGLKSLHISTEQREHSVYDDHIIPDPSTGFVHESGCAIGQVTVWESGQMEYEVIHIETEMLILWKYIERIDEKEPDFAELLTTYFQVVQSGQKP
ncbi:hypothetical protein MKX40_23410 [Paenibacillus sp. FSL R5-0517]|uniref:immunity protein TriTu family protein n=1 Tax=Paenibacillus sp. FSL R5-0517 TaxID=2921647 RepID=UPI0030D98D26